MSAGSERLKKAMDDLEDKGLARSAALAALNDADAAFNAAKKEMDDAVSHVQAEAVDVANASQKPAAVPDKTVASN